MDDEQPMEPVLNSQHIVRLLADPARRTVVAGLILADEGQAAKQIADATGLRLRTVVDAAARLVSGGLLTSRAGVFYLDAAIFHEVARAEAPEDSPSEHDDQPEDVARVLDVAFKGGKLVLWPSKRSKRLVVLNYLAQQFEIGQHYSETEVNDRLSVFDDDVATMRRYLVDESFLDRDDGRYWRCGGSV